MLRRTRLSVVLACASFLPLAACAAAPRPAAQVAPPVAAVRYGGPWDAKLGVDHPLSGRIWDVGRASFVDEDALVQRLAKARFVLLGERHDDRDHHRLQAALLQALIARGRHPAVAFEMVDLDRQSSLNEARAMAPSDPDAIARAVQWETSGWPDWAMYRPVFAVAVASGLPIVAADYPSHDIKGLFAPGAPPLDPAIAARYGLDAALPPDARASLEEELRASHCGMLPESMIPPMVVAQRLRDGAMAEALAEAARSADGVVLISGAGHARVDRGVPFALRRREPGADVVSVAFFEVQSDLVDPPRYAEALLARTLPFDFVWFTPRVDDADHCASLRAPKKPAASP